MKQGIVRFGLATAFALTAAFAAAQSAISVSINGQPVQFAGTGPQMVDGRVLVPLRGVFEKLGAYVEWHSDKREVVASRGQNTVDLQIGNPNATVNGQAVTMDVPAQILDGSTMVPIRFVSEAIGAQVRWQEAEQLVIITADQAQAAPPAPVEPAQPAPSAGEGPIRMARVSYIDGGLIWRPGDDVDWSDAGTNLPLRQGAELWLNPGSRAEIQFDDGSLLRLGSGAVATLHTMYSDDRGEFTEIRLNTGTASFRLTNGNSSYQIDTPLASITASGPSGFRVDASSGLRLTVRDGQTHVQGEAGQIDVGRGEFLRLTGPNARYALVSAPGGDDWDRFCDGRDHVIVHRSSYLPSNIAIMGGELDGYGTWVRDPQYGNCWRPNGVSRDWAPYRDGHWVWVSPFGWTWCGNEQWGWAPYHYGTWFPSSNGWCWRPGPAQQCWSPAVVHFSTDRGSIAWCPLAPSEVRYPPVVSVNFRVGNWAVNFAIGGAACYYPDGRDSCSPRPWRNSEINRTTNVYNITRVTNITNVYVNNNGFVPRNSRVAGGATVTTTSGFAGRDRFNAGGANATQIFTRGKMFASPTEGGARYAGPTNVRPTARSFSPSVGFSGARPNSAVLNRPVIRAAAPGRTTGWVQPMQGARSLPAVVRVPTRSVPPRTNPGFRTPPVNPVHPPNRNVPPVVPNRPPVRNAPPVINPRNRVPGSFNPRGTPPVPVNPPIVRPNNPRQPRRPVAPPVITPRQVPPPAVTRARPAQPPVNTRPRVVPPPVQPRQTPPARVIPPKRVPPPKGKTPPRKPNDKGKKGDNTGG